MRHIDRRCPRSWITRGCSAVGRSWLLTRTQTSKTRQVDGHDVDPPRVDGTSTDDDGGSNVTRRRRSIPSRVLHATWPRRLSRCGQIDSCILGHELPRWSSQCPAAARSVFAFLVVFVSWTVAYLDSSDDNTATCLLVVLTSWCVLYSGFLFLSICWSLVFITCKSACPVRWCCHPHCMCVAAVFVCQQCNRWISPLGLIHPSLFSFCFARKVPFNLSPA